LTENPKSKLRYDFSTVSVAHDDGVDEELEALLEGDREELEALGRQTELALDDNSFQFDDLIESYLFAVDPDEVVDQSLMPTQLPEIPATQRDADGSRYL
jgi:hypothetical protein